MLNETTIAQIHKQNTYQHIKIPFYFIGNLYFSIKFKKIKMSKSL